MRFACATCWLLLALSACTVAHEQVPEAQLSKKLLAWYPTVANDLWRETGDARGAYAVFLKLTAFDFTKNTRAVDVEPCDVAAAVNTMAAKEYGGLSPKEKVGIAEICMGSYGSADGNRSFDSNDLIVRESADGVAVLLKDADPRVRGKAAFAIAHMFNETRSPPREESAKQAKTILPLLKDGQGLVRSAAVSALNTMGAREYAGEILPLLKDAEASVRSNALYFLGEIKTGEYAKDILQLLSDRDAVVRGNAVIVLGNMRGKEYLDRVAPMLNDPDPVVRVWTATALGRAKAKEYVKAIAQLLRDGDGDVRSTAIGVLGDMVEVAGASAISSYADDIARLLPDADSSVRGGAASLLGKIGGKSHAGALTPLLKDTEWDVRGLAAISLAELGFEEAIPKEVIEDIKSIREFGDANARRAEAVLRKLDAGK